MPERSDVYAYFWTEGFEDPCEDITRLMQIEPSETRTVGATWGSGRLVQKNWWTLSSPLARGDNLLQEHLEALLPLLESRSSALKTLAERAAIGVNCVGYYYGANPGLHLTAPLISRLAALGLSVDFDIYNYAGEDAP